MSILAMLLEKETEINMKKYRSAWHEPYKIETLLNKSEIEERLGSQIGVKIILMRTTDFGLLSLDREIKDGKFQISPKLPMNWWLFFHPKIVGEIVETEDDTRIVLMWMEVSITDLLVVLASYTYICYVAQISVLVYASTLCLVAALVTICWQSARKRFGKRLKMLLKGF